jgi:aminopeptidase N
MPVILVDSLLAARKHVKKSLAKILYNDFVALHESLSSNLPYKFSPDEVGRRRLRNTCLDYIVSLETPETAALSEKQFNTANCMTDSLAALGALMSQPLGTPSREKALTQFYNNAAGDALVLNKWFGIQAFADNPNVLESVKSLKAHKDFIISNPNRARSLISSFAGNMGAFHAKDGKGYEFIADCVLELDKLNPQVASRLSGSFSSWRKFDEQRQSLMKAQLERILSINGLSKDTFEVVSRSLK